jgi:hypothetical protein
MADKQTHFGRAAEYFAMSELLLRGWNVAVPVVDVGDDAFVIDDTDKTTWRLQVKSANGKPYPKGGEGWVKARFLLSRVQLRVEQPIELFFLLMVRIEEAWRFLVIPRADLMAIRDRLVAGRNSNRGRRGRPPVGDEDATTDGLLLEVLLRKAHARGWDERLSTYLDTWPRELAPVLGGPGTRKPASREAPALTGTTPARPARSTGRGT